MTASGGPAQAEAIGAGAPSGPAGMWPQADWPRIKDEVKRLQVRIAKATREGRWGKVKALQRLLTRSHSGKMLAVKRVCVKALMEKVREIVRQHRSATQTNLILQLNPVIRGWAMYHRHVVSKAHFTSIDAHIWQLLWKWALRRHPTKGTGWVKHKYFHVEGHRTWAFTARTKDRGVTRLFRAAMVPIVRHVKIRGQANPFDPAWSSYFARRRAATDE